MAQQRVHRLIFATLILSHLPICPAVESSDPNDRAAYLNAMQKDFEEIRAEVSVSGSINSNVVVGFATSMDKILPRVGIPLFQVKPRVELKLARNEKEGFQVVVLPRREDIQQVSVRVRDLLSKNAEQFPTETIQAVPMGYVKTKAVPPYGSPHVGWWPHPTLDFMKTVDIAKGDAQSFWIGVRAPKSQAPGVYKGKLNIMIEGRELFSFDLVIRVYGFVLLIL